MAKARTAFFRYLLAAIGALGLSACSEFQPPAAQVDLQVSPSPEVQVSGTADYKVGTVVFRGTSLPESGAMVSFSLENPPEGVALVAPRTALVKGELATLDLVLRIDEAKVFPAGSDTATLDLTLKLEGTGIAAVSKGFSVTLRRSGGSGGGGTTPQPQPSLDLYAPSTLSVTQGSSADLAFLLSTRNVEGRVLLQVSGLPAGVSAAVPSEATVSASSPNAFLTATFQASDTALPGTYTATLEARLADKPEVKKTATVSLTVAQRASIQVDLALNRMVVFPGQSVTGTATVRSVGGASGTVAVSVSACNLPASAVAFSGLPYGTLTPNGTLTFTFTITPPEDAPAGLCGVTVQADLNGLQARAVNQFEIVQIPDLTLSVSPAVQAVAQGAPKAFYAVTLEVKGGYSGMVEFRLYDQSYAPLSDYALVVGGNTLLPDSTGAVRFVVDGTATPEVQATLELRNLAALSPGTHDYYLTASGPTTKTASFRLEVRP